MKKVIIALAIFASQVSFAMTDVEAVNAAKSILGAGKVTVEQCNQMGEALQENSSTAKAIEAALGDDGMNKLFDLLERDCK